MAPQHWSTAKSNMSQSIIIVFLQRTAMIIMPTELFAEVDCLTLKLRQSENWYQKLLVGFAKKEDYNDKI
jgi:hypothetical protein